LICLQEIVTASYKLLTESLETNYTFVCAVEKENIYKLDPKSYFTMILLNKKTCKLVDDEIIGFPNTIMCRNLLKVKLKYKNRIKITAMTTHLESTAEFSKQRVEQLKSCFKEITNVNDDSYVILGGDLNLRDSEVWNLNIYWSFL
jgi:hypothetical protein